MPSVSPQLLDLLLTVLAIAAAMGLSVYAALAVPGLAAYLDLIALPEPLAGLAAPPVWGMLLGLLVIEWITAHFRVIDLAWSVLHTLVKPQAAFLVAALGLSSATTATGWTAAIVALALALFIHLSLLAARAAVHTAGPHARPIAIAALQWPLAAGLALLAVTAPPLAAAVAAILLFAPLPWLPQVWGAALLPLRTALYVLTRPDRARRWDAGLERLPEPLRRVVETELGGPIKSVRSTPATLARLGSRRPFCRGRLVVAPERPPLFTHRRGFRAQVVRLGSGSAVSDGGLLVETVETEAPVPWALCVGPDAAPASAIVAAVEGAARGAVEPLSPQV